MARRNGRTQTCGIKDARERLRQAKSHLEVASLVGDTKGTDLEYASVAASVAILGGIAAADAACCAALKRRSRSDDHRDATKLLAEIEPEGKKAAAAMRQLIGLKDSAHYGFLSVSKRELKQSVRQASYLAEFAEQVILRSD
jgi:hypothetical protein